MGFAYNQTGLEHPLPGGMRDLLPVESERRSELSRKVLACFELFGYRPVTLPAFEYAAVLERGLGTLDSASVLRFVEPESGEVVALRPDMTPQVARLVATRMEALPEPVRLFYQGSVLRRRRERARTHQQMLQVGIELVGSSAPDGDLEVLEVATAGMRAAGLSDFVVDLGHAGIASALLAGVPREAVSELVEALGTKDSVALVKCAERARITGRTLAALAALPELHGDGRTFERARAIFADTGAAEPCHRLEELWRRASEFGWAPRLAVDLGETRTFEYYSGALFEVLAEGPGQPVASGGRYDELYSRFGRSRPAAGCAVDLDNLAWALDKAGVRPAVRPRVLVRGASPEAFALLAALRGAGVASALVAEDADRGYAAAWHYSHVLSLDARAGRRAIVVEATDGSAREVIEGSDAAERVARMVKARIGLG